MERLTMMSSGSSSSCDECYSGDSGCECYGEQCDCDRTPCDDAGGPDTCDSDH
jgi:hypothetical protein